MPGHPLLRKRKPGWDDLAQMPFVLPPPWASLRVKIEQQFFRHGLHPPRDVVETACLSGRAAHLRRPDS